MPSCRPRRACTASPLRRFAAILLFYPVRFCVPPPTLAPIMSGARITRHILHTLQPSTRGGRRSIRHSSQQDVVVRLNRYAELLVNLRPAEKSVERGPEDTRLIASRPHRRALPGHPAVSVPSGIGGARRRHVS